MILEPVVAARFINAYKKLLLEIGGDKDSDLHLYNRLAEARQTLSEAPHLLEPALARLQQRGESVADDVAEAVANMQVRQWLYLRDTRSHSIFIEPDAEIAYGVLGLTQRLKQVTGDSGVSIRTALLPFQGRVICDGLIAQPVWLGANYKRSFNELLVNIRAAGRFRLDGLDMSDRPALAVVPTASTVSAAPLPVAASKSARAAGVRVLAHKHPKKDPGREERILMEVVVDAYDEVERAIGWYCYLDDRLNAPFDATCIVRRVTSPLKVGQVVKVLGMAPDDECMSDMLVLIAHDGDELAVPLSQLLPLKKKGAGLEAVTDWHYWIAQGYEF